MRHLAITAGFLVAAIAGPVHGHGDSAHVTKKFDAATAEQTPFGIAGDAAKVTRTMKIRMGDTMRFSPTVLTIKRGQTVRFIVHNDGKTLHEMVLGTEDELARHAELMKKFPDMEHSEPHMVHVKPGRSEQMVWTFNQPGEFRFACLIPGHYEAGMIGKVIVKD
jgi:uncharacterized cupredoxin-like copper-binding protein